MIDCDSRKADTDPPARWHSVPLDLDGCAKPPAQNPEEERCKSRFARQITCPLRTPVEPEIASFEHWRDAILHAQLVRLATGAPPKELPLAWR